MRPPVVATDRAGVDAAAVVVRAGGVLLYPTETVYGLGCDPRAAAAVARIRALKGRDADKPMLALTDEWARVDGWLADVHEVHRRLMGVEGPLTILFPAGEDAPPELVGPKGYVGIRRTQDPFCRALVAAAETPIVSTSANPAGVPTPARFGEIARAICEGVDLSVDAGAPLDGEASTVVRVDQGKVVVVREGAVDVDGVQRLAG